MMRNHALVICLLYSFFSCFISVSAQKSGEKPKIKLCKIYTGSDSSDLHLSEVEFYDPFGHIFKSFKIKSDSIPYDTTNYVVGGDGNTAEINYPYDIKTRLRKKQTFVYDEKGLLWKEKMDDPVSPDQSYDRIYFNRPDGKPAESTTTRKNVKTRVSYIYDSIGNQVLEDISLSTFEPSYKDFGPFVRNTWKEKKYDISKRMIEEKTFAFEIIEKKQFPIIRMVRLLKYNTNGSVKEEDITIYGDKIKEEQKSYEYDQWGNVIRVRTAILDNGVIIPVEIQFIKKDYQFF